MSQSIVDDIDTTAVDNAKIKVFGVGGAGGNAIEEMINAHLVGVQFVCANTDRQALNKNSAPNKIQLGEKLTKGLGAGSKPDVGRDAAVESISQIREAIDGSDMIFITAGMGGGTGTGAAPVIAQTAKEMGILTVGVVTKPFSFEGNKRKRIAEDGLEELKKYVDSLIIIPNDRLFTIGPKKMTLNTMLQKANDVLLNAVRGISDVIMRDGLINVDFADVQTTMSETGLALMGTGRASGEGRAREAALQAIQSPLLENMSLESAKAVLYNITASTDMITGEEIQDIGNLIQDAASSEREISIIFGVVYDDDMGEDLQVTVIATGIEPMQMDDLYQQNAKIQQFSQHKARQETRRQVTSSKPRIANNYDDGMEVSSRRPLNDGYHTDQYQPPYVPKRDKPFTASGTHTPGAEALLFSSDDFEIPTFIRKQAN